MLQIFFRVYEGVLGRSVPNRVAEKVVFFKSKLFLPRFLERNVIPLQSLEEKEENRKAPDLSEEEKLQILSSTRFQQFFEFSSKIVERQLAEEVDLQLTFFLY